MLSTATSVSGQGVGSAYMEQVELVKEQKDLFEVLEGKAKGRAQIYHVHTVNPTFRLRMTNRHVNVIYVHFLPQTLDGSLKMNRLSFSIFKRYVIHTYRKADEIVVVNPIFIDPLVKLGMKRENISYIPNYVSKENFFKQDEKRVLETRAKYGIGPKAFVVLGCGQVQTRKGVLDYIQVAKDNPDVAFVWAGGFSFGKMTDGYDQLKPIMTLNDLNNLVNAGQVTEINVVVKADTDGSAQALKSSLEKLSSDKIKIKVLLAQAGAISDSDVLLASASHAIIYGFNVRPDARVRQKAEEEHVEIRLQRIIYELLDEMKAAMLGLVKIEKVEQVTGQAEIRHIYKISKVGTVAGSYVISGLLKSGSKVRLLRAGVIAYEGKLGSLKRFKEDAKEVKEGYECGLTIENFNDVKEGDVVEGYELVEKK